MPQPDVFPSRWLRCHRGFLNAAVTVASWAVVYKGGGSQDRGASLSKRDATHGQATATAPVLRAG